MEGWFLLAFVFVCLVVAELREPHRHHWNDDLLGRIVHRRFACRACRRGDR